MIGWPVFVCAYVNFTHTNWLSVAIQLTDSTWLPAYDYANKLDTVAARFVLPVLVSF